MSGIWREHRIVVLVVLVALSVFVLRLGLESSAFNPIAQAQEDCTEVAAFGPETEDQTTDPFEISGNTIRLTADLTSLSPIEPFFTAILFDEEGLLADTMAFTQAGTQTENFLVDPGTYTLELEAGDTEYTLTVEDCGASPLDGEVTQYEDPGVAPIQPEPTPDPEPVEQNNGELMNAGGPESGPVPAMPSGECPPEYPKASDGECYR
jgi:hypothetical protein